MEWCWNGVFVLCFGHTGLDLQLTFLLQSYTECMMEQCIQADNSGNNYNMNDYCRSKTHY